MKKLTLIAIFFATSIVHAQVLTPPTQAPPTNQGGMNQGTNTTVVNQSQPQQNNSSFIGNEIPMFDPSSNTVIFNDKAFQVNDNAVFRARFEKFLNTEEASDKDTVAYRAVMADILKILSPHQRTKDKLAKAVARLQYAAAFDQDAGLCDSIANAVYRMVLARKNVSELRNLNTQLDKERRDLDWNFKQATDTNRLHSGRNSNETNTQQTSTSSPVGGNDSEVERYILRIAEKEAKRVANLGLMEISETQSKVEFQGLIVQLFLQRRFEHVILAARIYTEFFADGAGEIQFEEGSDVQKTFSTSIGFSPTITTLDAFSGEAIRDVDDQVSSFRFLVKGDELDSATRQLQQAFVTGEYLPSVQSIPREEKRKILGYTRNLFQLTSALNVKDYDLAESIINKMKAAASDFDHSKPSAIVNTAKLTSNMKLRAAKTAVLSGDTATFERLLAESTSAWPTNPAIQTEFEGITNYADKHQQLKREFDSLLSTQSYRQIFNNQAEFIAATVDDPERQPKLKEVLMNIQEIQTVLSQADSLHKNGQSHAAWEIVERTFEKFPDDVILSAKRSDYTRDVAQFAQAIEKASSLEEQNKHGSSLAWYLAARRMYPRSQNAADGIKRLVDKILPEDDGLAAPVTGL